MRTPHRQPAHRFGVGMDDTLSKPFNSDDLRGKIKHFIGLVPECSCFVLNNLLYCVMQALKNNHGGKGETTGFQSQAQDYLERVIDLSEILNLQRPGVYPVRVDGAGFAARGIHADDILIVDTAASPAHGRMVVAFVENEALLACLERRGGSWLLRTGTGAHQPVTGQAEIWGIVTSLVRQAV